MARSKATSGEEPSQQSGEEERVVDPPAASPEEVRDPERTVERPQVRLLKSVFLTLPSGSSYAFNTGDVHELSSEDANFLVSQGYGAVVSGESEG